MTIEERLAGVHLLEQPVWVFDSERGRIVWANSAAIALWRAEGREELLERDFSDMSAATRARNQSYLASFREGRTVREEWTWYPKGVPVTVRCHFSGIALDDGRVATLVQGVVKEGGADPTLLRGIEALRHTSAMVALLDRSGHILTQNPAVLRAFGPLDEFHAWFVDASLAATILRDVTAERVFETAAALLGAIVERRARDVILDLTGADTVDVATAEHLVGLTRAVRLLGARPILTGIRPALALTFVETAVDLTEALLLRDLHQALDACRGR